MQYSTEASRQEYDVFYRTMRLDGATFGVRSLDIAALEKHFSEVIEFRSDRDSRSDRKGKCFYMYVYTIALHYVPLISIAEPRF